MDLFVPALTGVLILVVLWDARARKSAFLATETRHLHQSLGLLQAHKAALETFLDAEAAPSSLKRLAITHSDAMADRRFVHSMAKLLASRSGLEVTPEDEEVVAQINALRTSEPDLFSNFLVSIVAGTCAAVLQWPESAAFFEEISTRMAADPKRDLDIAVTASRFRNSELPFGVPHRSAIA